MSQSIIGDMRDQNFDKRYRKALGGQKSLVIDKRPSAGHFEDAPSLEAH